MRVLVADSNEAMRLGIRSVLDRGLGDTTIDDVANHLQLIMHLGFREYDAVLVDPMLAKDLERPLLEQMLDLAPEAKIIVFSNADEMIHGEPAIRAGAKGFLMKTCSTEELTSAVSRVSRGDIYTSHELAVEIVIRRHRDRQSSLHDRLTERELQVFAMQVCGVAVKDVARGLNLSVKTVSTHKTRAMLKLKIKSFTEMVQYAIAQGIFEDCQARCASLLPN